jgi:hypothetical protein
MGDYSIWFKNGSDLVIKPERIKITLGIEKVIYNKPATIVKWGDGTKTVVKCQSGDNFDPEKGLAMAIVKKLLGNSGNYNEQLKKWLPKDDSKEEQTKVDTTSKKEKPRATPTPNKEDELKLNSSTYEIQGYRDVLKTILGLPF